MIDKETAQRIIDAATILDVVQDFVRLKKRGQSYVGLCPFHDDSNPSFYVSPSKNICKCFSCGEGGTPVHFIMKHEQLSYWDALRFLAKKYNIEIEERAFTEEEKQEENLRESLFIVNAFARNHFVDNLHNTEDGRTIGKNYFLSRGFREETIRKFELGYALGGWDFFYKDAVLKGYQVDYLEQVGLIMQGRRGYIDRFMERVIFPVHSLSGKVVAFGGRTLKKNDKTAKYINSPESAIYHKSNELYGIFFAKHSIIKQDLCYLVEGYADVISMHQAGIENVVASSGTALTIAQVRLIRRFTKNVTVLYDGDNAGIKAALRGIDLLLEEGLNVKVVLLPEGEDPDSYAQNHLVCETKEYLETHQVDFIRFKTDVMLKGAENDPIKKAAVMAELMDTIALIPEVFIRSVYIKESSDRLGIKEEILLREVNKRRRNKWGQHNHQNQSTDIKTGDNDRKTSYAGPIIGQKEYPFARFERSLMRYVVRCGERKLAQYEDADSGKTEVIYVASLLLNDLQTDGLSFYNPVYCKMLEEVCLHLGEPNFKAENYLLKHEDVAITVAAADLMTDRYFISNSENQLNYETDDPQRIENSLSMDIYAYKNAYIQSRISEIIEKIKMLQSDPEKTDEVLALMTKLNDLNRVKAVFAKELGERTVVKI